MALWKEICGYEGMYAVSSDGEVVSLPREVYNGRGTFQTKSKRLKQGCRSGKYKTVHLSKDGTIEQFSVHRLVAIAFLENPENLPEVNHKDENPGNNRVDNLEWCSRQYNIDYSKSKRVAQYEKSGLKIAEYKSIAYAARVSGVSRTAINNCLTGWSNTAGNYIWRYEEEE